MVQGDYDEIIRKAKIIGNLDFGGVSTLNPDENWDRLENYAKWAKYLEDERLKTGKWDIQYSYYDLLGVRKQSTKRGFDTKREAEEWVREFSLSQKGNLNMSFDTFVKIYKKDIGKKIRESTMCSKEYMIDNKILPYFKDKKLNEIEPKHIIAWHNEILEQNNKYGKPYAKTYLRSLHSQISAIFNHAVRFYGLKSNPAAIVGSIGSKKAEGIDFWTKEEYLKFADAMMDKPVSFYAFEVLYWCGLRIGELLALTKKDIDLEKSTISINKSYQRINKQDVITPPKTEKSNRVIKIPEFLRDELEDYFNSIYNLTDDTRLFQISKSYLHHEMIRGCKETGVKKIRIHDLRHSHTSLLIDMGFSAVAIAERLGHESYKVTLDVYAHLFPERQTEIAEKLNIERTV